MIKIYKKLMVLLDRQQKKKMVLLVFLMLIGAILETLGVSMILPVMNVVLEEDAIAKHWYLQVICDIFHVDNSNQLTILVMVGLVLVFVIKNIFLFFQQKVQLKFVYTNQFATSRRMMINFMQRPYEYYLNADTAACQRGNCLRLSCRNLSGRRCVDEPYGHGASGSRALGDQVYFETDHEKSGRRKSGVLQRSI